MCCITAGVRHRTCPKVDISAAECEIACSKDPGCKGYSIYLGNVNPPKTCKLATVSTCSGGPVRDDGNLGPLDPLVTCHDGLFDGCFAKRGKYS